MSRAREYVASVCDKAGRVLYRSAPHPDRMTAAREALAARPNARSVRTEGFFNGFANGMDMQWLRPDQIRGATHA